MATVVNIAEITRRFQELGWTNLNVADTVNALAGGNIPAGEFMKYLDAVLASPGGFDDQAIVGCAATNATKITNALRARGVEAT
jgi:hypothetical protein